MKYVLFTALICSITLTVSAWTSLEESLLNNYGDMIFRPDSMTLCVLTTEGDTVVFADTPHALRWDLYHVYSVISYVEQPDFYYWVIESQGYEWLEWYVVSGENGRIYLTISNPGLSPDGHRLLFSNWDDAEFRQKGIQIWRIDTDSLALEFSDLDVPWAPYNVSWESESVVLFQKARYNYGTGEMTTQPGRLELSSDSTWIPEDPESWD